MTPHLGTGNYSAWSQRKKMYLSSTKTQINLRFRAVWLVFVIHVNKLCRFCCLECTKRRFRSACANAQADLNLRWAHMSEGHVCWRCGSACLAYRSVNYSLQDLTKAAFNLLFLAVLFVTVGKKYYEKLCQCFRSSRLLNGLVLLTPIGCSRRKGHFEYTQTEMIKKSQSKLVVYRVGINCLLQ